MKVEVKKAVLELQYKVFQRLFSTDKSSLISFVLKQDGLYLKGYKDDFDLSILLKSTNEHNFSATDVEVATVNYRKLGSILGSLGQDVTIDFSSATSLLFDDTEAEVYLEKMLDSDLDVNLSVSIENGVTLDTKEFLRAITTLHNLTSESKDNLMGDMYFHNGFGFVVDTIHLLRYEYSFPHTMILNRHTSKVLKEFLLSGIKTNREDGANFEVYLVADGSFIFKQNGNLLKIINLPTFVKDVKKVVEAFSESEIESNDYEIKKLNVNVEQMIKFINLALIFLSEKGEEDIIMSIKNGTGQILSDTGANTSKGLFEVDCVGEFEIGLNAREFLRLLKGLKTVIDDTIELTINFDIDTLKIGYNNGDIYISIAIY